MKPELLHPTTTTAVASGGGLQRWSSPIPYLFGGLGLMLGAIALALIILACSYRKSASTDHDDEEKSQKQIHDLQHEEMEPRVVIMAGDTNPTHLATPVAATRFSTEKV
ncbi:hypothetical protein ACJIZ3_001959 [Penstemon smallii]|uniref:Uncharacterized protein n=1 Tax=Penstemon smallii TaxID=265156 RepID=A0ABD3U6L8_9LAMI